LDGATGTAAVPQASRRVEGRSGHAIQLTSVPTGVDPRAAAA
jgi:hypothetical protein